MNIFMIKVNNPVRMSLVVSCGCRHELGAKRYVQDRPSSSSSMLPITAWFFTRGTQAPKQGN
jgi:hypothetical protein